MGIITREDEVQLVNFLLKSIVFIVFTSEAAIIKVRNRLNDVLGIQLLNNLFLFRLKDF